MTRLGYVVFAVTVTIAAIAIGLFTVVAIHRIATGQPVRITLRRLLRNVLDAVSGVS